MNAPELFAALVSDVDRERLDAELLGAVNVDDPLLGEVATHLIAAGGKRLRPALTLAAATLSGRPVSVATLLGGSRSSSSTSPRSTTTT